MPERLLKSGPSVALAATVSCGVWGLWGSEAATTSDSHIGIGGFRSKESRRR